MLDDHDQHVLDATAARLHLDDPDLAEQLRHHTLTPRRSAVPQRTSPSAPRPPRVAGLPAAWWPPLVMVLVCLSLVIVPAALVAGRDAPPEPPVSRVDAPAVSRPAPPQ